MALKGVTKPKALAPIFMVCGDPGSGKSSLANSFGEWAPVIFIRAEDVSGVFDSLPADQQPDMLPKLPRADKRNKSATSNAILGQLDDLIEEDHDYGVCVIDTVSVLDDLFHHEVLQTLGGENLAVAGGGYGAGWQTLSELHADVIAACLELREKRDMTIVWLAHQKVERMRNRPDAEEAIVFGMEMHERCHHLYRKHADAVLFTRMDSFTKGVTTDKKGDIKKAGKVIASGDRSIITTSDGAQGYIYAKNRYDLPPELPFPKGEAVLLDCIDYYKD